MTFSPSQCQRVRHRFGFVLAPVLPRPVREQRPPSPRAAPPLVRFSCLTAINSPRHTLQPQLIVRGGDRGLRGSSWDAGEQRGPGR